MNWELPDVQAGFRKGRGIRDQIANIHRITEKAREFRKTATSALPTTPKPLTVWTTTNCGKFLEMGIPDHLTCLLRNLYAGQDAIVRTRHGTMDWFQIWKEVCQGCILSPCLFNLYAEYIMQNAGWMKHKLESRLLGEISMISDMRSYGTLTAESKEELKSLLMKVKEEKNWLKTTFRKPRWQPRWNSSVGRALDWRKPRWHLVPSLHGKWMGKQWKQDSLSFLGLQNHCRWWLQPWN